MSDAKEDIFEAMVAGKINDIRSTIDEIEREIGQREGIDVEVMAEIQDEIMKVRNRMLEIEQFTASSDVQHPFPKIDTLEREVINLEGQKRFEKVSCWRDITSLRKELRFYMKDLNDVLRKAKLVKDDVKNRGPT